VGAEAKAEGLIKGTQQSKKPGSRFTRKPDFSPPHGVVSFD
jgi:hypothetical protein